MSQVRNVGCSGEYWKQPLRPIDVPVAGAVHVVAGGLVVVAGGFVADAGAIVPASAVVAPDDNTSVTPGSTGTMESLAVKVGAVIQYEATGGGPTGIGTSGLAAVKVSESVNVIAPCGSLPSTSVIR
jgi:hypothetical protein